MRRHHSAVDVELIQADLPQAHQYVQRGEVDLALTYHFGSEHEDSHRADTSLERLPVAVDDVRLVLPADHPAARNQIIGIEEIADATWLIASPNFRAMLTAAAAPFGFAPQIMRVADDYVTMQALVAHGLGVALVPNLALTAHRDDRIVPRTLRGWPQRHIAIELWADMLRVDAVRVLVEHLQAAALPA